MSERITSDSQETALAQYRPYSAAAVVGLLLSAVSIVAFWHPILWCLPVIAAIANIFALRRISHFAPELAGRGLTLTGLALSLIFGIAAPTRLEVVVEARRADARNVALRWFAYLRDGEPEKAAQLQLEPRFRKLPGDDVWAYYRHQPKGPEYMEQFVLARSVRNLLALVKQAQVRYYQTEVDEVAAHRETMMQLYAVTFERDGRPTTFFVRILLQKHLQGDSASRGWWIVRNDLVTQPPESWAETESTP